MSSVLIALAAFSFFIIYLISPLFGIAYLTAARNLFSFIYTSGGSLELSAEGVVTLLVIIVGIFGIGKYNFKSDTFWAFILFIVVGAATFFVAFDHVNFFKKLFRLIGYLFLYLMAQRFCVDKKNIRILSVAIIISMFITIPPALHFFKTQSAATPATLATSALDEKMGLLSKNNFGFYASYMTLFLFYPLAFRLYPLVRYVALLLFPVLIAALLLSYTRAAWVGFFVAFIVFIVLSDLRKKIIVPFLIVSAVIFIFSSMLYKGLYVDATQKRENGMSSWDYRTKFAWPASIKCIKESPVFGYGLGNDMHAMKTIAHFDNSSHNDYLLVAVDSGMIGLSSYLFFLVTMYARTYKAYKAAEDKEIRFFCLVTLAVFTSFIVGSIAEHLLQTPGATGYVITMLGMAHGSMNAAASKTDLENEQ
jgi:O-antigen ligase